MIGEKVPAIQLIHLSETIEVLPFDEDHAPAGHSLQDHTPAGHSLQDHAPAGHSLQDHAPVGHSLQDELELAPKDDDQVPSLQFKQVKLIVAAIVAEYAPGTHCKQVTELVAP